MRDQTLPDPLEAELVALGRTILVDPPPADLVDRVLLRISATDGAYAGRGGSPVGSAFPTWWRTLRAPRRRAVAGAVAALLLVLLVPPVRAAVLELFRIGGVTVREVPAPSGAPLPTGSVRPPTGAVGAAGAVVVGTVAEASSRVGFDIAVPSRLGPPTTIALTHDTRVVEMTWGTGPRSTRLDVFTGSLSFGYLKSVWDAVTPTDVDGHEAVWFDEPHLIEWVDRAGRTVSAPPRVAGPTLVWVDGGRGDGEVTYRLEGPTTLAAAVAVAESAP